MDNYAKWQITEGLLEQFVATEQKFYACGLRK
jgi:hypothetical protein